MSYLKFEKEQLINLEYSLNKEILRSNRAGAYISTTITGCNTRKYHGLLVCPIENFGGEKHVLLSALDESILENGSEFSLGIRRYQGGIYEPKGHKYISSVEIQKIPKYTYEVGNVVLTKERILGDKENKILIRYTLVEAAKPVKLRFRPFLAFRNIHHLSKANMYVNRKFVKVSNGIGIQLYDKYPVLYMQFTKKAEFIPVPDWYYNVEYLKELNRGYEYLEDLFVPGYFEVELKKGESLLFAAGTEVSKPSTLPKQFDTNEKGRIERTSFLNSLDHAAHQFVMHKKDGTDIVAGFPWYNSITRQTFVSLPGLCLSLNDKKNCHLVLDTYLGKMKNGFFPDSINLENPTYHAADSSLWFIWTLNQYYKKFKNPTEIWKEYSWAIQEILQAYKNSSLKYVGMNKEGLIFAKKPDTALTWMNSVVDGNPVIQRDGYPVEVNALWYNAICFAVEIAEKAGDTGFVDQWKGMIKKVGESFLKTFWIEGHNHLADVVKDGRADWSVRPNMVIAVAMNYTPLSREQQKSVIDVAKKLLLTPRGLRTLSPDHIRYKGVVEGNHNERELAVHQGAVWPWLIQFFIEAYLKVHKKGGLPFAKQILNGFENDMTEHCIGTMSEMYNGNPPHRAKGAISQAWSVAALVYSTHLINNYKD